MTDRLRTRFVVIGTGVAGLHAAWRASAHGDVTILTKASLFDSATAYAQGGIAAALGAGDSPQLHRQDTLAAGAALCDSAAVEVLVAEGPQRVRELASIGARLPKRSQASRICSSVRRASMNSASTPHCRYASARAIAASNCAALSLRTTT